MKIEDMDLYEMLGVPIRSSTADIKKAYRKKALQCHPDKNPDNPKAAALFHQLSKILEVLTDEAARKAYDRVLKGKKEAALRHKELDSRRKKLKEDLEAREKRSGYVPANQKSEAQRLREEIERLRKEGSKQVEEEVNYVLKKVQEEKNINGGAWDSSQHRIKVKWHADKSDVSNGGYNYDILHKILFKYGDIVALVISPKKRGTALVEYSTERAAEMAVDLEKGLSNNPLTLVWLNNRTKNGAGVAPEQSTIKETDFESIVLHKMRQAEERKRLIEQMQAEDD